MRGLPGSKESQALNSYLSKFQPTAFGRDTVQISLFCVALPPALLAC